MIPVERESLMKRATAVFGEDTRSEKLIEECSELINALIKLKHGRCDLESVADEMADVYITLANFKHLIGARLVDASLTRKLAKFTRLVEAAERVRPAGNGG